MSPGVSRLACPTVPSPRWKCWQWRPAGPIRYNRPSPNKSNRDFHMRLVCYADARGPRVAALGDRWIIDLADAVGAADRLKIETRLNGQTVQSSNTSHFIFSIEAFVAYASDVCTLSPGDLIFTGTASGRGASRESRRFFSRPAIVWRWRSKGWVCWGIRLWRSCRPSERRRRGFTSAERRGRRRKFRHEALFFAPRRRSSCS